MQRQIEDKLDEALDALVARGRKSLRELLVWFPGDSEVRDLFRAAESARSVLSATPDSLVRALHLAQLMTAAGALQQRQKAWQLRDVARSVLATIPPPKVRALHLSQLMAAARALQGPRKAWRPRRTSRLRALLLRPIVVVAVAGAMMTSPVVALASVAGPGDGLYGTKLALERVELALEWDPVEEVKLHLEFAERRITDLSELLAEGLPDEISRAMRSLDTHLGQAERGVSGLKEIGEPTVSFRQQLTQVLSKHLTVLGDLIDNAECGSGNPEAGKSQCKGLLNALRNSRKVLDDVRVTRQKAGHGRPETAGEGPGSVQNQPTGEGPGSVQNQPTRPVPAGAPTGEAPPGDSNGPPSDLPGRGPGKASLEPLKATLDHLTFPDR